MFSTLFDWCLVDSCTGNGRGGESIYGGFFEGKDAIIRAVAYLCQRLAWGWMYNLSLFFQMKALLLSTIRSTCCQWPIEAKIQMDHSFSCKYRFSSWIYGICMSVKQFSNFNTCDLSEPQNLLHIWMGTCYIDALECKFCLYSDKSLQFVWTQQLCVF